jgi:polysaccharide biosynthesis transport protein
MTPGSDGPRPEFKLHPFQRHAIKPNVSPDESYGDHAVTADARPAIDLDATEPDRNPHIREYVMALYRRRWIAMAAFALVFGTVAAYTFTATPIYVASARVLFDSDRQNIVNFKEVVEPDEARSDYYQTQYNLLESRSLARQTLLNLNLMNHPELAGTAGGGWGLDSFYAFLRKHSHGTTTGPAPTAADETRAESAAIDNFIDRLEISPLRSSRLTDVGFRSTDPALAARLVNEHVRAFIEQNLDYRFQASKEASDWLAGQLKDQRRQVEAAEIALQRYRESTDAISMQDRENIVVQKLADVSAAVTRAKTERIEKEARYQQLLSLRDSNAALDTFSAVLTNSFIQQQKAELTTLQRQERQLSERLGDRHPDMIKVRTAVQGAQEKLDSEIAKVVESVKNEFLTAQAQERALVGALNAQKLEALATNRKGIEYGVLQREVESSRQVYDSLLQRAKETGVSGALKTSNIRVVDAAEVPRSPVSPRRMLNLLSGMLGGGLFAIFIAFFFEYIDNRLKSPEEVTQHLGLPTLAVLPHVEAGGDPLVTASVAAGFTESIRGLRTNLLFAKACDDGPRTLVLTSTGPEEGKSVTAANVAISLAEAGHRVLLVDADLRRPRMNEIMSVKQEPGLSNILVGSVTPSQALQRSTTSGLWLLAAGRIPPNPAELLGSEQFVRFLASLKGFFDWVIIDSPPVMAVTDATILAQRASAVLFVVQAEKTNRYRARHALSRLRRVHAPLVGVVLNGVNFSGNSGYYSDYYSPEYTRYYVTGTSTGSGTGA